ncbi:MAG: hypothetical protein ACO1RX_08900 [Candidatus Sericytochromatia bacterium]
MVNKICVPVLLTLSVFLFSCTFLLPQAMGPGSQAFIEDTPVSVEVDGDVYVLDIYAWRSSSFLGYSDTEIVFYFEKSGYPREGKGLLKAQIQNLWLVYDSKVIQPLFSKQEQNIWRLTTLKEIGQTTFVLRAELLLDSGEHIMIKSEETGTRTVY